MIGLVFDACRYLQDNNEWEKAAWVAKVRLNEDEQNDVIKRWSEYLCTNQINRKVSLFFKTQFNNIESYEQMKFSCQDNFFILTFLYPIF